MKPLQCLAIAAVVASMGYTRPALAEITTRISNAVDVCQGSLPSFEGALRKRPLAIKNEGKITAFVTCSMRVALDSEFNGVAIFVTNRNASPLSMSCTLVDGIALPFPNSPPVYLPLELSLPSGETQIFSWPNGDPLEFLTLPNVNCALPAGVEINYVIAGVL